MSRRFRPRPTTQSPVAGPEARPPRLAEGSNAITFDELREQVNAAAARPAPQRFGGNEIRIETDGERVAVVFPGAMRLYGSRDEAIALAAALMRAAKSR